MNKGVIFDLDQTLVDSSHLDILRKSRDWKKIQALIPTIKEFPNVSKFLRILKENNIKVAIVTSSPKSYSQSIISYFKWEIDLVIGFHDVVPNIKPSPKGYEIVLNLLELNKLKTIVVGDRKNDIIPANSIGLNSIFCKYGNTDKDFIESSPTFIVNSTDELFKIVLEFFDINL